MPCGYVSSSPPVENRTCDLHRIRLSTFDRSQRPRPLSVPAHFLSSTGMHPWTACACAGYLCSGLFEGEGPSPWGVFPGRTALPSSDYDAPSVTPLRPRDVVRGLPLPPVHLPGHPERGFPCSACKTQVERVRWRVSLLAPSALCGFPVFTQRVGQGDLCDRGPPIIWFALVLPLTARL